VVAAEVLDQRVPAGLEDSWAVPASLDLTIRTVVGIAQDFEIRPRTRWGGTKD
jgi:hypothetical protein